MVILELRSVCVCVDNHIFSRTKFSLSSWTSDPVLELNIHGVSFEQSFFYHDAQILFIEEIL